MDVRRWFRRYPSDADLQEELEAHLAMRAEHDGTNEVAARRRLGNVLRTREAMRRVWMPEWLETLAQDLRYTWRSLRRNLAFTTTVALMLALAIGANTAVFSVVQSVLLRPLPYPHSDRLVRIESMNAERGWPFPGSSIPNFLDWRAAVTTFEAMEGFREVLHLDNHPERWVQLIYGTADLMDLLGARAALGRLVQPEDERPGVTPVVVLTYECWAGRFGRDPAIVGRTVRLGEHSDSFYARGGPALDPDAVPAPTFTVIGVAEPLDPTVLGPIGSAVGGQIDGFVAWNPAMDTGELRQVRFAQDLTAVGRLAPGATLAQAQAELDAIGAAIRAENPGMGPVAPRAVLLYEETVRTVRPTLLALLGATGLVLLIAISNVAGLQLARGTARMGELAVRTALGATRRRIARLLLTESLVLSALGGLIGIAIGYACLRLLLRLDPSWIPRLQSVTLDGPVLGVSLAATIGAGLAFGLAPVALLRDGPAAHGRHARGTAADDRHWTRSALVVVQLALSLVLLAGSGLMIRTVLALQAVPIGFDYRQIVTFALGTGGFAFGTSTDAVRADRLARYRDVLEHVRAIPGVRAATLTSMPPLSGGSISVPLHVLGGTADGQSLSADLVGVTAEFFDFFGSHAVEGRLFSPRDAPMADRLVVVDATLARTLWPGQSAVGQRIRFANLESEVIGVVEPIRYGSLTADLPPKLFHLLDRIGVLGSTVLVRHDGEPGPIISAIAARVNDVAPTLQTVRLRPLSALYDLYLREPRFYLLLLSLLGALGLAVAAVGVYGMVAYSVERRTGEIGIRFALGAQRRHIGRLIGGHTATLVAAGLGVGLVGALWLSRYIENLLFQVRPADPVALGSMAALLAATALAATLLPLRRALMTDPAITLRSE